MDSELERFKIEINITEYAAAVHGYHVVPRESSQASVIMEHSGTGDKIVVRREADEHWVYFSLRDDRDNGTILDFALRRGQLRSLGHVRRELRTWLGGARPVVALPTTFRETVLPQRTDRAAVRAAFDSTTSPSTNSSYLNRRGIRPEILVCSRFLGTWREDARGNVIFPHTDGEGLSGYEIKNRDFTGFSAQGLKTAWRSNIEPDDSRLVVTESAIDALSYHQLKPDDATRYLSTGGSLAKHQPAILREAVRAIGQGTIILAFDNDAAGDRLAEEVEVLVSGARYVRSKPKTCKDWNDVLQARERDYISSLA